MQYRRNDSDTGKPRYLEKTPSLSHIRLYLPLRLPQGETGQASKSFKKKKHRWEHWIANYFVCSFQKRYLCAIHTLRLYMCHFQCVVGPCHHGMARPQVADRGTASGMEGSCE